MEEHSERRHCRRQENMSGYPEASTEEKQPASFQSFEFGAIVCINITGESANSTLIVPRVTFKSDTLQNSHLKTIYCTHDLRFASQR